MLISRNYLQVIYFIFKKREPLHENRKVVYLKETEMARERKAFQECLKSITWIHPKLLLVCAW